MAQMAKIPSFRATRAGRGHDVPVYIGPFSLSRGLHTPTVISRVNEAQELLRLTFAADPAFACRTQLVGRRTNFLHPAFLLASCRTPLCKPRCSSQQGSFSLKTRTRHTSVLRSVDSPTPSDALACIPLHARTAPSPQALSRSGIVKAIESIEASSTRLVAKLVDSASSDFKRPVLVYVCAAMSCMLREGNVPRA